MIELVRKDMRLYAKVLMNLRLPVKYENKVFNKGERVELLLHDEVMHILAKNGNILFWNGKKYIKLNLGQYYDIMQRKAYKIIDHVEPKPQQPKVEPKKEEPKPQPKIELRQQPKKEEPKPQPKVEPKVEEPKKEVVKEEPKQQEQPKKEDYKQNDNKKQRHNNNNNNNNKQGGDK